LGLGGRKKYEITQDYPDRGGNQTEEEAHGIPSKLHYAQQRSCQPLAPLMMANTHGPVPWDGSAVVPPAFHYGISGFRRLPISVTLPLLASRPRM
jgi:hypothetical protein